MVIFVNAVGVILFLQGRTEKVLSAVVDPLHPDWAGMSQAFGGFALYAVSLLAVCGIGAMLIAGALARRTRLHPRAEMAGWTRLMPAIALAGGLTALVVLVLIEVLLFQDYGVHLYEFDVVGILANAALRRDLGIQPAEVLRVTVAAMTLLAAELLLCAVGIRLARWRDGTLPRACAMAMVVAIPGGLAIFRSGEEEIHSDRAEFEGALPLGKQLLLRSTSRPFIPVTPLLGPGGYPVLAATDPAPTLSNKSNIVFFVADGLRGDMFGAELTPNLTAFGGRPDVITSRRHYSTGHVSEAGIFGLVYALGGHTFHSFIESRVKSYPMEVLKRNGYHTLLLASSRLSPYPSDQLVKSFDEVVSPQNDDEALEVLRRYIAARRTDRKPYFVLGFFYTPHYPFTSAKPHLRKFPMVGPKARTNYMNDVLQSDDYFKQTLNLVGEDFEQGRTIVLATSDHGEEIRDHGAFGHASATFWNEKIVVPFLLGIPNTRLSPELRRPSLTSHVDVWPTLFQYLGATPRMDPSSYSDGRSLLDPPVADLQALVTGRFFPYADRPSVLIDGTAKYWFRVSDLGANDRLCVVVTRATDLGDKERSTDPNRVEARMVPAFEQLQASFWRFLQPSAGSWSDRGERRIC
ncbi:MAG: sulfatase-like hydrolase/transferase [Gemmatimonadaceae bacterium]